MRIKQLIIGLIIFIVITVFSFILLSTMLLIPEMLSGIIAIILGFSGEVLYKKFTK